jgi:hypothetical protein
MTIIEARPAAAPVFEGRGRVAAAVLLVLGPLFMFLAYIPAALAQAAAPGQDDAAVAVAAPTWTAVGWIVGLPVVPAMILWALTFLLLARPWARIAAWTGCVALVLQSCALAAVGGMELLRDVMVQNGFDPVAVQSVMDSGVTANPAGIALAIEFFPTEVVALIAIAIAFWRTKWVPKWVAVLFLVFPFIDFLVNDTKWWSVLAFAVFLTANAAVASRVLRNGAPRPIVSEQTV